MMAIFKLSRAVIACVWHVLCVWPKRHIYFVCGGRQTKIYLACALFVKDAYFMRCRSSYRAFIHIFYVNKAKTKYQKEMGNGRTKLVTLHLKP